MIFNATIIEIDTPAAPSTGGDVAFSNGSAIALRCAIESGLVAEKIIVDGRQLYYTATVYLPRSASTRDALEGSRLWVTPDGDAAPTAYIVRHVAGDVGAGGIGGVLAHWKLYLLAA